MSVNLNDAHFDFKTVEEFDLKLFLTENKNQSPEAFLLHSKYNTKNLNWFLAEQLKTYPKATHKLPTFVASHCWFTGKSYEQSSSESSALFKSSLFSGNRLLDLSGGLGIDDWAFSKSFKAVISLDPDHKLNELVRLNWEKVGTQNCIRMDTKAEDYLGSATHETYDLVYLDADRRDKENRKQGIAEGSPNFFAIKELLFKQTNQVLLKLSPMIDINYCLKELPHIQNIWIVSIEHEIKEILCHLDQTKNLPVQIQTIEIDKNGEKFQLSADENSLHSKETINPNPENSYFFEPAAALIKSGLSAHFMNQFQYQALGKNTYYFTGNTVPYPLVKQGRIFQIIKQSHFAKSTFKHYLKSISAERINISSRNFGLDAATIEKNFKLKTGGDDYFFFCKNQLEEKLFFHCRKISD